MNAPPHIYLAVTNDLTYDQRMSRICGSLSNAGYNVTIIGRELPDSAPLESVAYEQVRLKLKQQKGKLFYLEFNYYLYKYLVKRLSQEKGLPVAICAIDLDTIAPCYLASRKFKSQRVYDAHELFTELTEVKRRPWIHAIWKWIESKYVPKYKSGYTVNQFIADEFYRRFQVKYAVIRNLPAPQINTAGQQAPLPFALPPKFFLYQGAVNEGRAFDTLIPAMKKVPIPLLIAGDGNYFEQVKRLVKSNRLEEKVLMTGYVQPAMLKQITPKAFAGITIFDNSGLNQYYSLANRFFDYVQAGIPQLCCNYPEYAALNKEHEVALLIDHVNSETIAEGLNNLLRDNVLYSKLQVQCKEASSHWNWHYEEQKLIQFWNNLLPIQ